MVNKLPLLITSLLLLCANALSAQCGGANGPLTLPLSPTEIGTSITITTPFCNQPIPDRYTWLGSGVSGNALCAQSIGFEQVDINGFASSKRDYSDVTSPFSVGSSAFILRFLPLLIVNPNGTFSTIEIGEEVNPLTPKGDGISVIDITAITSHILGSVPFTGAWQFVAADVNDDTFIDVGDMINIRRFLLFDEDSSIHISWEYPTSRSLDDFNFGVNTFVTDFEYEDEYLDVPLGTTQTHALTGVKVGDVNASNSFYGNTSCLQKPDPNDNQVAKSNSGISLRISDRFVRKGDSFEVPMTIHPEENKTVEAIALSLNVDPNVLQIVGLESKDLNLDAATNIDDEKGTLKMLWTKYLDGYNDPNASDEDSDNTVFVKLKALEDTRVSDSFSFNTESNLKSSVVLSEISSGRLEEKSLEIVWDGDIENGTSEPRVTLLSQNPFVNEVNLNLDLPDNTIQNTVTATLYDINGRIIETFNSTTESTRRLISFKNLDNLYRGIYVYSVYLNDEIVSTGKVVKQ